MITLKKNGIFYENDYSPEHKRYVREEVKSIIPHLNDVLKIDEDFTLLDFFRIVEDEEEIMEIIFGSYLGHFPLSPYIQEIAKDCPSDSKEDLEYIFCSWDVEQFDYKLYYEKHKDDPLMSEMKLHEPLEDDGNEITISVGMHGWGKNEPTEDEPFDPDMPYTSYAIEFTPLYRLKHLPLKLDEEFIVRPINMLGSDDERIVEGKRGFIVFEVFGAILSEISFCGSPENRDVEWENISNEVKEARKKIKEKEDKKEEE